MSSCICGYYDGNINVSNGSGRVPLVIVTFPEVSARRPTFRASITSLCCIDILLLLLRLILLLLLLVMLLCL